MACSTKPRRISANAALLVVFGALTLAMGALVVFTLAHRGEAQPKAAEKPASTATP